tara:strand:+ start:260 stop:487 length:228 start_codon:yes stop_codon:yes gene_type:complete
MSEKPVTDKLEKMNVSKNHIEDEIAKYQVELEKRKQGITTAHNTKIQLEAEANSILGSISALRKLLIEEEEVKDE